MLNLLVKLVICVVVFVLNDYCLTQDNIGNFQQPFNQNPYYLEQLEKDRQQQEQLQQQQFQNNLNKQNYYYQYYLNRPTYNVEVNTISGRVRGTTYQVASPALYQSYLYVSTFLGIPYAAPPTGENRFQLPREPEMRVNTLYDATYFRSSCYQDRAGELFVRQHIPDFPASNFSEDCLYLNIFAPNRTDRLGIKYPVVVFIHGGGFSGGSSQLYNGFVLAQRGLVVVTINYRLGPLGFLSTETLSAPGNFGLHDQRMAMKFVYENIEQFNGDKHNITLMGHEAGAASVGIHILSEASRQYFHKAILMSGSDLCTWSYLPKEYKPLEFARILSRGLGCYDYDTFKMVQCLRQRSAHEIMNANIWVPAELGGSPWRPVIDGNEREAQYSFLQQSPQFLRRSGKFYNISVIVGVTSDEGAFLVNNLNIPDIENGLTTAQYEEILRKYVADRVDDYYKWRDFQNELKFAESQYYINKIHDYLDEEGITRALQYRYTYWPQPENATMMRQKLVDLYSDSLYVSCVDEVSRYHAQKWPNRTFMYVFQHRSIKANYPIWMGSPHGYELYYIFGVPFFNDSGTIPWFGYRINSQYFRTQDQEISNYTMHLIANFARWSNPTPFGYFNDNPSVLYSVYNLINQNQQTIYNQQQYSNLPFLTTTTADAFTRNLNITWQPMQPSNMTYLIISAYPEIKVSYRFDEAGFWNHYWLKLWDRRLTITPTPALRNAVLSYQDSYILVWVFISVTALLIVILTITCAIVCRKIKNDKHDEDEF